MKKTNQNKCVGHRKLPELSYASSGMLLRRGCEVNDGLHSLPTGNTTYFPRGVYRYNSFDEANHHWISCLAKGIARVKNE